MTSAAPLMRLDSLSKRFPLRGSWLTRQRWFTAVDGVDLAVQRGEVLGIVGESGSGKTTLGRMMARLERPSAGTIHFDGADVTRLSGSDARAFCRRVQMIHQNPFEALDPRLQIRESLLEPLRVQHLEAGTAARLARVRELLARTGLNPPDEFLYAYPHHLSGGQRQRVVLARAFVLRPRLVIADEPVSMLDVSVRASILSLMLDLKRAFDITYVYITHDLASACYMCDRIAVMRSGAFVEVGPTREVISRPRDAYSAALIAAVPAMARGVRPAQS